jgi:hypothetical protein
MGRPRHVGHRRRRLGHRHPARRIRPRPRRSPRPARMARPRPPFAALRPDPGPAGPVGGLGSPEMERVGTAGPRIRRPGRRQKRPGAGRRAGRRPVAGRPAGQRIRPEDPARGSRAAGSGRTRR